MKQVLQNLGTGEIAACDVPAPAVSPGRLLIRTRVSLISAGTERMLAEFGKAGWLEKARQQPDKVRQALAKVRTDGVLATLEAIRSKLDEPLPLGYCNVGVVEQVGPGVEGFRVGDRVVSNGKHAEVVCVPVNLCARVPDNVTDECAALTVVAAIGLQGIRLVAPTLGECVVVTGLGLIGLLCVQMLRAHGCRVLGIDLDPHRLELAKRFGAEVVDLSRGDDPIAVATSFSRGRGVDAVLITASTRSSEPVAQAARMCRKRGRIVLVGVAGLELSRADFYEKELSFQVSCSYGPGRYDPAYEERGQDYPVGFVRWTEQRNFEAVLDLMAAGALDAGPMISHRFHIEDVAEAYRLLLGDSRSLGILLSYCSPASANRPSPFARTVGITPAHVDRSPGAQLPSVAFIGAGNYAGRVLIPAFRNAGITAHTVVSATGVSAAHCARKYGFSYASTDADAVIANPEIDAVVIATRHDSHARYVLQALRAGKHVFVEKPLCLTLGELAEIRREQEARPGQLLMVGFNRRFAPHVLRARELLESARGQKAFIMTVNAGAVPADHWTQNPQAGGGRIIGEACHFVDLLRCLTGHAIVGHSAVALGGSSGACAIPDTAILTLEFADGSIGAIHYYATGNRKFPKERLEIFCSGRILQIDNFRTLRSWGWSCKASLRLWRQDKGAQAAVSAFVHTVRTGGPPPIPPEELFEVSATSIELMQELRFVGVNRTGDARLTRFDQQLSIPGSS